MNSESTGSRADEDRTGAIIVAAGFSQRMWGMDKIFAPMVGVPLLAWAVDAFENSPLVNSMVIVLGDQNLEQGRKLVKDRRWTKVEEVCQGGARRQDSVRMGLERLSSCKWVMVHDAARPCVTETMITRGLETARHTGAAIAAMPSKDTIKTVSPNRMVTTTLDRTKLWLIQTPQVFRRDLLEEAHRKVREDVTDDSAMLESLGHAVQVFDGAYSNIKVTTPDDLGLAEAILRLRKELT
jgi:2-C-methyl-D-erythritol 4-phosphate cytidylyltransferase